MARKRLGEMLIEAGVLDEHRLRAALADQRRWGRSLGKTLVEMGFLAEETLVAVLGQQLGLPAVDLRQINIPYAVLNLIPPELLRQHHLIPFNQRGKFLDVAMVDPTNLGVIDELRIRTQLNINPHLAGPRQLDETLDRYFHKSTRTSEVMIAFDPRELQDAELTGSMQIPMAPASRGPAPARPAPEPAASRAARPVRGAFPDEGIRPVPYAPPAPISMPGAPLAPSPRDAEIDALQDRIMRLEALVERDEQVLRKLLALLIDKGIATRDEILERLG